MNEKNLIQKRQTAKWAEITDLLGGVFIKNSETEGSVYRTKKGFLVSRANVFGVVLSKDSTEFVEGIIVDDGTGNISVKSFEKKGIFDSIEVGDIVNVIGKVREYSQSPFVSAETVKKSDNKSFALRKKEISLVQKFYEVEKDIQPEAEEMFVSGEGDKILAMLKELDKGDGVDIGVLAEKAKAKDINEIVTNLIRNGEVFEILPGKLKVLE